MLPWKKHNYGSWEPAEQTTCGLVLLFFFYRGQCQTVTMSKIHWDANVGLTAASVLVLTGCCCCCCSMRWSRVCIVKVKRLGVDHLFINHFWTHLKDLKSDLSCKHKVNHLNKGSCNLFDLSDFYDFIILFGCFFKKIQINHLTGSSQTCCVYKGETHFDLLLY